MSFPTKRTKRNNTRVDKPLFPDRASCDTLEQYDAQVKAYWKTISLYRDLASELHRKIMYGKEAKAQPKKTGH